MNRQSVCDFFYNCNRGNVYLERKLYNMLCGSFLAERKHLSELAVLYGLIGQTRDIIGGKGERDLAYMQIYICIHVACSR